MYNPYYCFCFQLLIVETSFMNLVAMTFFQTPKRSGNLHSSFFKVQFERDNTFQKGLSSYS